MALKEIKLKEALPDFAAELRSLLLKGGHPELTEQVSALEIVDRCRCGDWFCATFYTTPRKEGSWIPRLETIPLDPDDGEINVDVQDERIVGVEVLYRPDVRKRLFEILP